MSKCFFFAAFNFCETGVIILSVGETNFGFLNIGSGVSSVVSMDRTGADVLLLGHPLRKESFCPEAHLAIVVTEWDRSLRWVVKWLDM